MDPANCAAGLWVGDIYRDDFRFHEHFLRERARLILRQQSRQFREQRAKLAETSYEEGLQMARFFIEADPLFTGDSEERLQDRALAMYLDSVAAQSIINSAPLPYLAEFRDGMHTTAVVARPVKSHTARQRSLEDRAYCMHLDKVAADYMKNTKLPRLFAAGYDRQKKVGAISARYSNDFLSTYARVLPCSGETNEQISEDEEEKEEENEQVDQIAKTDNAQKEDEKNEEQARGGKEKTTEGIRFASTRFSSYRQQPVFRDLNTCWSSGMAFLDPTVTL